VEQRTAASVSTLRVAFREGNGRRAENTGIRLDGIRHFYSEDAETEPIWTSYSVSAPYLESAREL
jgi:hypothetical protein